MVDVNGAMVPPQGEGKSQGDTITYSTIDKDNKDTHKGDTIDKGWSLGQKDNVSKVMPEATGKDKGVDGKRVGENLSISFMSGDCWIMMLMHVHLQSKNGCTKKQMANAKKKLEAAADKWNAGGVFIPCKSSKKPGGCIFIFRLVWHNASASNVINVRVDCSKNDHKGSTVSGGGNGKYIEVAPPDDKESDGSEGYYAHELGHNMFGTQQPGNTPPEGWSPEGHSPGDKGIMRDTEKTKGIEKGEKPSPDEMKALYQKYGLVCDDGCCKDEKSKMLIHGTITRTDSTNSGYTVPGGIVTRTPDSTRIDGFVFIKSNMQD